MMDKDGISLRAVEPIIWRDEKQRLEVCGSVRVSWPEPGAAVDFL